VSAVDLKPITLPMLYEAARPFGDVPRKQRLSR